MSTAHQTERFSEAFDRMLTSSQQSDFDHHLATCEQCTTEFEQYRTTIAKVRDLPLAKMPTPVRIPAGLSPRPSRFGGILGYFRRGRGAATAVGLVAAAGLLVLASHQTSSTNPPATSAALKPGVLAPAALSPLSGGQAQAQGAANVAPKAYPAFSCTATRLPAAGVSPPATYGDVVTVSGNGNNATKITVAVPNGTVHAGEPVPVYARATVSLETVGAHGTTPAPPTSIGPCIQASTQATAQPVNNSSLSEVNIPGTARSGDKITIVATVPAGSDNIAVLPELQATLTLTVQ